MVFVAVLTGSIVNVVLPLMGAEFGASAGHIGWVVAGYALAYAAGVPLLGRVSDLFGVRRVFDLGAGGVRRRAARSAPPPDLAVLVSGRAAQGIGAVAIPALATVAVARVLPPGRRGGAMGC